MKTEFTKEYLMENCGFWHNTNQVDNLFSSDVVTLNEILDHTGISFDYKLWFYLNSCQMDLTEKRWLAVEVAEIVLPIYESKYPKDNKVRDCIEKTKLFIKGECSLDELKDARLNAAYANNAAATACNAADAAACVYAAYVYTYNAITACVYAAVTYATYATCQSKIIEFLKEFSKNNKNNK